jgi:DNA-binding beta-propeller fold protein YncE
MRNVFLRIATALCALLMVTYTGGKSDGHENGGFQLVGAIPIEGVEGRIDHMAADPDGRQLFIAALGSDMVVKIDTRQRIVVGNIRGIKEPQGLAYIPKSNSLAVASGGDGNVRIYDQKLKLVSTVNSLEDADNMRYDPGQDLLYVGYGRGALAIIDPNNSAKIGEILLDGHPESFQLERKGKRIFVNVPAAREIEVLDREKRLVLTRWKLTAAAANFPMALDESNQRLFVGCRRPARLLILDTVSGQIVANMKACGDSDDLFYDSANTEIYLSGGDGCISIFDAANPNRYSEFRTITTPIGSRTSLFVPANGTLHVAVPHRGSQKAEILIFN